MFIILGGHCSLTMPQTKTETETETDDRVILATVT